MFNLLKSQIKILAVVLIFALFANKAEASQPQMAKFADTIQKTYYSADLGKYRCVEDSVSNTETTVTCDNSGDFIYTFRKIRDGNKFDLLEVTLRRTGFQILKIYDSREGTAIFYWDNSSKEGSLVRTIIDIETISFDAIVEFAGLLLENVASSSTFKGDKTFSHFLWQSYVEHGDKAGIAALRGIKNSVVTTGEFLGESVAWVLYGEVVEDAKNFAKSLGHLARHPEIIKKIAYDKKTEFLQASPEKQAELIGHLAGDIEQAILGVSAVKMAKAAPVLQKVSQAYTAGKESALAFLLNVATHDITDRRFLSIVKKYVMRSSSPEEGLEEMKKLLKEKDLEIAKLKAQNVTDELTRVMNRHGLFEKGIPLVALSQRSAKTVAAIAIDLDNFKVVNDLFGHDVGDDVLKRVSQIVNEQIRRKSDLVVRMGGEEFVVLLPESSSKGALPLAEAIRKAVESDKVLQALLSKHSDDLLKNLSSEPYEKALAFTKASFGREIPEELTSVMAHINKSAQNSVKERLEDKAALIEILRKNTPKNQTISVGVSSLDALATYEPKQFIKDLIALADVGLRDAKKLGKNQVVIHNH